MILSAFSEARPLLGVADLARAVGLNQSTTHRYVATLAALGYLQQDPDTRKYSARPARRSTSASPRSTRWRSPGSPARHLQALSDETGYTVSMAVLDGADIVYVERCRSAPRRPGWASTCNLHVGSRLPAYCTSMGKVLLAYREPDRAARPARPDGPGPARPEDDHRAGAAGQRAGQGARRPGSRSTTRNWRPGCARSPRPIRDRSGARRRRDQHRRPPDHLEHLDGVRSSAGWSAAAAHRAARSRPARLPPAWATVAEAFD